MNNNCISITDPNEIKEICREIFEINQLFKRIYNTDGFFTFEDGVFISYNKTQFPQYVTAVLNEGIKTDFFEGKTFTINCKELFDYNPKELVKTTKEPTIKEIRYESDTKTITFDRRYNKLSFEYKEIDIIDIKNKINKFDDFIGEYTFDEDLLKYFKETNKATEVIIPIDDSIIYRKDDVDVGEEDNYLSFLISNKFIIGNSSKMSKGELVFNDCRLELYGSNEIQNVYLIKLIFNEKYIDIEQFFILVDIFNSDD